ncbi:class I SAM-dependent methyltransferase [Streptomyces sp. NPDC050485]|uniref:class I SAM-dependent methyltransferase n=1 Tax=Streptomyces sp. NPDC050485 TaxID=3365617 RepID=UPI0037984714
MIINEHSTAEYWNRAYKKGRTYRAVTHLEVELFQAYVKAEPGMVAADIGCGTGSWSRALASMGLSVTGYDISGVAEAEASSRSSGLHENLRFAEWDMNGDSIPQHLAPRSVDIVTCRLVLAFLDRQRFLVDTARWVKPDGVVHIVTPVHERLKPTEKHRGLTERQIEMLGAGWKHVSRYNVAFDGSITAILLQHFE